MNHKEPVSGLTRHQLFSELSSLNALVGGRRHVDKLNTMYVFKGMEAIRLSVRYSELEQELTRRREADALWRKYVHTNNHTAKLEEVARWRSM